MWFAEDAFSPAVLLAAAAIGIFAASRSEALASKRSTLHYIALVLAIAILALFPIERWLVTSRERVKDRLHAVADAARNNDVDRLLTFIASNSEDVQKTAHEGMDRVRIGDDLTVSDVDVQMHDQDTRAVTRFLAKATVHVDSMGSARHPTRWELTWRESSGEWKIVEVKRLSFINGEEIGIYSTR